MSSHPYLNIALADCLAHLRLSKPLADLRLRHPGTVVRLWERNVAQLRAGIVDGEFDIGLCQSAHASEDIEVRALWQDPLVLACSEQHPLIDCRSISLARSVDCPWIELERDAYAGCCDQIDSLLRSRDFSPPHVIGAQTFDLMMAMVAAGYGVGLVPLSRVQRYRAFGVVWYEVEDRPLVMTTYLMHRRGKGSPALESFVESLQSVSARSFDAVHGVRT